jgi:hypothetical protein
MYGTIPFGVKLVCSVYIVNTVLFILSLVLFNSRILVFGNETGEALSSFVRFMLVFVPVYLYFRMSKLKKDSLFLAIGFHAFFLVNTASSYLEYMGYFYSIIHITGLYGSDLLSSTQMLVSSLSAIVNLIILGYLYKRRDIFASY